MSRVCGAVVVFVSIFSSLAVAQSQSSWSDLLRDIRPNEHGVAGSWSKSSGELRTTAAVSSRIVVPSRVPREYDLRVEFTRESGQHSVAIFFTSGSGRATFEIDAWAQHLAGIQLIDGKDCRNNSTRVENRTLQNGRRYTAEIRVRQQSVRALLDGTLLATYHGDGTDLSLVPLWRIPDDAQLAVGAYQAATTFHKIEMRPVSEKGPAAPKVVMRSPTATDNPSRQTSSGIRTTPGRSTRPSTTSGTPSPRSSTRSARPKSNQRRVLIVIADNHFFYREYADPRQELERAGFTVDVAAGNRNTCYPHENSGQGRDGGGVRPDFALSQVDPNRYEAIMFAGGWGASMYQFAFRGRYNHPVYNGDANKKRAANELINAFAKGDKFVCGICNGVSVLAWSRVNGKSLLAGKQCTAPTRSAPAGSFAGYRGTPSIRWHVEQNQGRLVPAGSIGNPRSRADDVVVDGKVITAEDDQSAREAGHRLAELLGGSLSN